VVKQYIYLGGRRGGGGGPPYKKNRGRWAENLIKNKKIKKNIRPLMYGGLGGGGVGKKKVPGGGGGGGGGVTPI